MTDTLLAERWRRQLSETVVPAMVEELVTGTDATGLLECFRNRPPSHAKMAEAARALVDLVPGLSKSDDLDGQLGVFVELSRLHGSRASGWSSEEDYVFAKNAMERLRKQADKIRDLLRIDVHSALVCAEADCRSCDWPVAPDSPAIRRNRRWPSLSSTTCSSRHATCSATSRGSPPGCRTESGC